MENHILELLRTNRRVIIPGFGAFIVRQKEPWEVSFNELLTFDDGLLSGHIEKVEKTDRASAEKKVTGYAGNLKEELKENKYVSLPGIGELAMDAGGKVRFRPGGKKEKEEEEPAEAGQIEPESAPFTLEQETGTEPEQVAEPPAPPPPRKKVPKGTLINILYGIAVLVFLLILIRIFYPGELRKLLGRPGEPEQQEIILGEERESGPEKEIPEQEKKPEQVTPAENQETVQELQEEPPATAKKEIKKYRIVAGCFRSGVNADNYVKELRRQGFDAEKFGMHKGLHAVSFASFADREKAVKEMKKIREAFDHNAWVLYY